MQFEKGMDVVCIRTHSQRAVIEGNVYTIKDIKERCNCGTCLNVGVDAQISNEITHVYCFKCGELAPNDGWWWVSAKLFKPLDELTNIDELLEVLEEPIYAQ